MLFAQTEVTGEVNRVWSNKITLSNRKMLLNGVSVWLYLQTRLLHLSEHPINTIDVYICLKGLLIRDNNTILGNQWSKYVVVVHERSSGSLQTSASYSRQIL